MPLIPGERLVFSHLIDDLSTSFSEEDINEKYVRGEVRIVTEQARYPLPSIPSMIASGNYELNPEFQRRRRWDQGKKSRLIESFIMNVPIPPIFLYEDSYSHYEVMDGLQRLTTINEFYEDQLTLEQLELWPELNGYTYSNLPDQVRRGVDRRYLSSIILLQETAKDKAEATRLKQLVFERINSGGAKLESQEARNAIHNGPMNQLCIPLSRNRLFCEMWGIPIPTRQEESTGEISPDLRNNALYRTMKDVEIVLRFFAYRQRMDMFLRGALDAYLDNYLEYANEQFSAETLDVLAKLFIDTIGLIYKLFGAHAFHFFRQGRYFNRPILVVYEPMTFVFSNHLDQKEAILSLRPKFQAKIKELYTEHEKEFDGRAVNQADHEARNNLFEDFVNTVLGS